VAQDRAGELIENRLLPLGARIQQQFLRSFQEQQVVKAALQLFAIAPRRRNRENRRVSLTPKRVVLTLLAKLAVVAHVRRYAERARIRAKRLARHLGPAGSLVHKLGLS